MTLWADVQPLLRRSLAYARAAFITLARPSPVNPKDAWPVDRRQLGIAAGAVLAILLIMMMTIDAAAVNAAGRAPRWVIGFFAEITDFGKSAWALWPLGLLFAGIGAAIPMLERPAQLVMAAIAVRVGFLFLAVGVPSLFVTIVKRMIGRGRPHVTEPLSPFLFKPFAWAASYASMPSGHATTAFAILAAGITMWPRARTILLIYALLIAASRIFVGAHYPSDVVAGALVGIVGALMVRRWFALRRLGFSIGPDGAIHRWPGPSLARIKAIARALLA